MCLCFEHQPGIREASPYIGSSFKVALKSVITSLLKRLPSAGSAQPALSRIVHGCPLIRTSSLSRIESSNWWRSPPAMKREQRPGPSPLSFISLFMASEASFTWRRESVCGCIARRYFLPLEARLLTSNKASETCTAGVTLPAGKASAGDAPKTNQGRTTLLKNFC